VGRLRALHANSSTCPVNLPTPTPAPAFPGCSFRLYRLDSLRTGVMAGASCPVEVMKRVRSEMHMADVTICYGMTETSPVSFQTSADGGWVGG
jgi:acyl-CoA synthetase (AMP-forming)/AMP-acid ligase II